MYCGTFSPLIKDYDFHDKKMVEKPVLNNKGRVTGQREIRPVWNNAQRVNHQNKFTHPHPKRNFVPTTVVTKSGQVPVNTAKQSSPRAATSISTARPVNTAAPKSKVNDALPKTYSYFKAHSPIKRAFNQKSAAKTNNLNEKVKTTRVNNVTTAGPKAVVSAAVGNGENAVKSSACWIWRPTGNVIDHTSKDSGSYMFKRFNYDQGFLTVDGLAYDWTGKLDFEDVYFVKELKFNLFSVSQICDKKNSVLFTKTECLVLYPDFKLLDESIENQINHRVKIIRCDNGTEFKNNEMNQFCQIKGIMREFSVARTPQQNGVAEINNRTLIEAARTMLVDSLLPTTFWAEAINTACYVQNKVLVTKPHNKTPYELLISRPPNLDFMRPFGCHVTMLNTLDLLGKFEGKAVEGFLVRYSVNSKAFRVFNTRTRKVEENLHVKFLENKSNVAGSGPERLFDIDSLTKSMNYEPVTVGNQTNGDADDKNAYEVLGKGDEGVNKVSGSDDQERTDSSTQDINTYGPSINTASTYINIGSLNINT
ncbi:retrovirus-related pol polyprotein from transposon TNT 1-94, partial [Tanacetum coccineum]